MLRCAAYARYSSDRQSPASIQDQLRKSREYAEHLNWELLVDHVYTDEALSGAGADRPGLLRLMAAAAQNRDRLTSSSWMTPHDSRGTSARPHASRSNCTFWGCASSPSAKALIRTATRRTCS